MKKVLAASPVAALPKLDFLPAKTLINDATVNWWLSSSALFFVLLLCVECKAISAFLLACCFGISVAAVNCCTHLFMKTALQLQVLKEYRSEESDAVDVAQLVSLHHKRELDLDVPAADAYDRALQALTTLPEARVTKIKMLDGIIMAEAAHGVRLKVEIEEDTDEGSHLVLSSSTHFLRELFYSDRSLQTLLHFRRHINNPTDCQPQQILQLFKPSAPRSLLRVARLGALAGAVTLCATWLVAGIQEGRNATEARAQYKLGNYEAVVQSTARITRQTPEVVSMRAIALANTGKTDQAISLLTERITKDAEDTLYVYRAYAYVMAGDISKALLDLDRAEETRMHMDFKHYVRALIAEHDTDYEQAADELVVAIELNSEETIYHQESAKVLRELKEVDEALEETARAEVIMIEERSQLNCETGGMLGASATLLALLFIHRMRIRKRA